MDVIESRIVYIEDDPWGRTRAYHGMIVYDTAPVDPRTEWDNPTQQEIDAYNNGRVYGFVVDFITEGFDDETIDSCYGYYGDDEFPYMNACIDEAIERHRNALEQRRFIVGWLFDTVDFTRSLE